MILLYYRHDRKNKYEKGETNNNVPQSNNLLSFNTNSPT